MTTLRLTVFCTTSEAWDWMAHACRAADHFCLAFQSLRDEGVPWTPAEPIPTGPLYGAFIVPANTTFEGLRWSDQRSRTHGWIEVRRGLERHDSVLLYTEFLFEKGGPTDRAASM